MSVACWGLASHGIRTHLDTFKALGLVLLSLTLFSFPWNGNLSAALAIETSKEFYFLPYI